jgi:hypothetical protein
VLIASISCSKDEEAPPPDIIPEVINGVIKEFGVTPVDITTPDKSTFSISMNNTMYKVESIAVAQSQSNAILFFASDSILTDESREFANLGKDAIAYSPVAQNLVTVTFNDGRKVSGSFDGSTSFGGVFGEQLISQWRDPADQTKPNQKAKDDISKFVTLYSDKDGAGPDNSPVYLLVQVSKL